MCTVTYLPHGAGFVLTHNRDEAPARTALAIDREKREGSNEWLIFPRDAKAGGAWMVAVAGLAGLGYAAAYAWYRRIEVPIVVHFGVNAVHFLLFTYPALRG